MTLSLTRHIFLQAIIITDTIAPGSEHNEIEVIVSQKSPQSSKKDTISIREERKRKRNSGQEYHS
jgi:hypothetical protein